MSWPEMSFMRLAVSRAYRGDKWKAKVRAMPDQQVIALYFTFKEKGQHGREPTTCTNSCRQMKIHSTQQCDPLERFTDESDRDYYDRINQEL